MTSATISTVYHAYRFDLNKPAEKEQYEALREKLTGMGLKCFESWGGKGSHYSGGLDGVTLQLETKHLFNNQWNTAPVAAADSKTAAENGMRVFDWAQDACVGDFPRWLKRGHWLEQTPEMAAIRRDVHKCGYCGAQEPASKGLVFCPHCIDSQYLEASNLYLTRLVCIADTNKPRPPLTEEERAALLPLYKDAQLHGTTERGKARIAKERADVESKFRKATHAATTERDGMIWLMDHGIRTDNCIYYSHTDRFCFGWRSPVSDEIKSALLDIISEFPFSYDIKCADGRTLSGD